MIKKAKNITKGTITIENGANIWPHELHTAKALASAGYNIRFIPNNTSLSSADAYVNNTLFEFKAPEGSSVKSIQRNLVKALNRQSPNIVIDSFRMRYMRDSSIRNYLISRLEARKGLKRLIFVTKTGNVIDINELVR